MTLSWLYGQLQLRGQVVGLVAVLVLFSAAAPNAYYIAVANNTLIVATISVSFCLLLGNAGQISLGHAAFFAISGYISAILTTWFGWSPAGALVVGVGVVVCLALILALPLLRLRGHHLAIATLGLGLIVQIILNNEADWTGGPDGMSVQPFTMAGFNMVGERLWFAVFALLLVVNLWLSDNLLRSPWGRALRSLHGSEIAAQICGINVDAYKVWIFVYSAAVAGLMGSLASHYTGSIAPSSASFLVSFEYIMAVVLGGLRSPLGAILGAMLITTLPAFIAGVGDYEMLIFGLVLLCTMVLLPRGLLPTLSGLFGRR